MKARERAVVGVVAAACLVVLIIAMKDLFRYQQEIVTQEMIAWVIIYFGVSIIVNFTGKHREEQSGPVRVFDTPWFWIALMGMVTLLLFGVYALG